MRGSSSGKLAALAALALLAASSSAGARDRDFGWSAAGTAEAPALRFGAADGARETFRLSCGADGTRLIVFVRGAPRGLPQGLDQFETRIRLFLGRTEYGLGGIGTRLADGHSRLEALLPDVRGFFAAMERQGRLVAVTFAGRSKAPAPDPELSRAFLARCAGRS